MFVASLLDCCLSYTSRCVEETAIHMVSVVATELSVVLGHEKVASKSNGITAIPELLKALYINRLFVTIDAEGCQKNIARQILSLIPH